MTDARVLVLGASGYQLDTIVTAQRMGYEVITTDNMPDNPGHTLADKSYPVDTTDHVQVLDIARRERASGVLAPCTDVAVPTAAYVAERLQLCGPPLAAAITVTNKIAFRRFQAAEGFPTASVHEIRAEPHLPSDLFSTSAFVLKPDRSSGSKGAFVVTSEEQLAVRLPETLAFSPTGTALLEPFLLGHQGTCEGVLRGGRLALAFFLDRQTASPPYVTTIGHHVPTTLSERRQREIIDQLERLWAKLGVTDGPFDCDFIAGEDQSYVLEMSPRLGGNSISGLLRRAAGFDLVEYGVRYACGEDSPLPREASCRPAAVVLLGVWRKGSLVYDEDELDRLASESWVDSLTLDVPSGELVFPFINGRHRVGEAFITGANRSEVDERVIELRDRLALRTT